MRPKVSIPKGYGNPGTPEPKDPNLVFVNCRDIENFPKRKVGNTVISDPIKLSTGAKAVGIYVTPSTIKIKDGSEGDPDAVGFVHEIEAEHPGREDEFENFMELAINEDWVILAYDQDPDMGARILGYPANPMKMESESQDDSDAVKTPIKMKTAMRCKYKIGRYTGPKPELAPASNASVEPDPGEGGENEGEDESL